MKPLDTKKLEALLAKEDWPQAKKLLEDYLQSDLTPEEKGAAYVKFASIYLDVTNRLNQAYKETLEEAVGFADEVKAKEKEIKEKAGASSVKQQIKKLYGTDK